MKATVLAALAAALCAGCASHGTISLALDELGSEQRTDTSARGIRAKRAINMTGISGPETVGMLVTDPDPPLIQWPSFLSSNVLPDTLAVRISTECSKLAVQVFPEGKGDERDVVMLRELLDGMNDKIARKAVLELRRKLLQRLSEQWAAAQGDAAKAKDLTETAATLFPGEQLDSADAVAAALAPLGDDKSGSIGAIAAAIAEDKQQQADLRARYGLIVTQWSVAAKRGFWGSLGEIFGIESSSESNQGGILIISGLRVASLVVGDDFWWRLGQFKDQSRQGADGLFDGYVVTHQLAAKRWAYSERIDLARYLKATFDVSKVSALTAGGWLDLIKEAEVNLKAEITTAQGARNLGALIAPERQLYEFRMTGDRAYQESVIAEAARANGYKSIYSVRTQLDNLRPVHWDKDRPPTSDCGSMQVTSQETTTGLTKVARVPDERLSISMRPRVLRKLVREREVACIDFDRNLLDANATDSCEQPTRQLARARSDSHAEPAPIDPGEIGRKAGLPTQAWVETDH